MKNYFLAFSFVFMCLGLFGLYTGNKLFVKYSVEGAKTPSTINSIKLNQHGSFFYVTKQQNDEMNYYQFLSVISILISMGGLFLYKRRIQHKK